MWRSHWLIARSRTIWDTTSSPCRRAAVTRAVSAPVGKRTSASVKSKYSGVPAERHTDRHGGDLARPARRRPVPRAPRARRSGEQRLPCGPNWRRPRPPPGTGPDNPARAGWAALWARWRPRRAPARSPSRLATCRRCLRRLRSAGAPPCSRTGRGRARGRSTRRARVRPAQRL